MVGCQIAPLETAAPLRVAALAQLNRSRPTAAVGAQRGALRHGAAKRAVVAARGARVQVAAVRTRQAARAAGRRACTSTTLDWKLDNASPGRPTYGSAAQQCEQCASHQASFGVFHCPGCSHPFLTRWHRPLHTRQLN